MSVVASNEPPPSTMSQRSGHERRVDSPRAIISRRQLQMKVLFDRVVALLLLIPGLPLIGLLVGLIRLTSRGPGVYAQLRVGQEGRNFTMYKLRSMRIDAEAATGPVWAGVSNDPRVTALGHWLRRLHLDELPQLFNVLRGEMSLVGPRPERPEFVKVLAEQIPGYMDRLKVQPGVTGLAQVNLPADTDLTSVRMKLSLDREYISEMGISLDIRIILCTILRVCGLRGGRGTRLLGLQRTVYLPPDAAPVASIPKNQPPSPETIVINKVGSTTVTYQDILHLRQEIGESSEDCADSQQPSANNSATIRED